jgi:hypothetical protein
MNAMTLGGYTFWRNPTQFDIPKDYRSSDTANTYSGVMFFSWGIFTDGQEITLEWDWMTDTMFNTLQTLLEQDTAHNWNSQLGTSYVVQILKLEGKYLESALSDAPWRRNVKLTLLIRSESL